MGELGRGVILDRVVREGIFQKMTFEQRSVGGDPLKRISGKGKNKFKSPEVGTGLCVFKEEQRGMPTVG